MTITPEQAAEKVVGRYTVIQLKPKNITFEQFFEVLDKYDIHPCLTCGAYRRADRCEVCEKVEAIT